MAEETEPHWLNPTEMAAWTQLLRVMYQLPQVLDQQLRDEAGISHVYYGMLATLSAQPEHSLPMGDLARMTATSPSRLTHAVTSLEKRGWVVRRQCETNRRVQFATLTDEGYAVLKEIAPQHVAQVRQRVFDQLTREQVEQLRDIAGAIAEGLGRGDGPGAPSTVDAPDA